MAATPYMQSMLETPLRIYSHSSQAQPVDPGGNLPSMPDISTGAACSDTDGEQFPPDTTERKRRGISNAFRSRLHNRKGSELSSIDINAIQAPSQDQPTSHAPASWRDAGQPTLYASDSDLANSAHSRSGSICTLSRLSFASRLAQLVSIPLPTASSLQARISSQPTALLAAKSLAEAGDQIRTWTRKACDVLKELDAQDDVEWSAAAGRDGFGEMDQAISHFEGLVRVYVISMEELQMRSDITTLSDETLKGHVDQLEGVVQEWSNIKRKLKEIKEQVELALDWEDLWNSVLGEVGQELTALEGLIFTMEEKRHDSVLALQPHSLYPAESTRSSPVKDESHFLALFARMQPLRASLDFLPMRLAAFSSRAGAMFPTGCTELDTRRDQLEQQWQRLHDNATALRKELGEDKWLAVFRNSGIQAQNMFDSVERSYTKLSRALASSIAQADPYSFAQMVESFEAKKIHYVPAIERVLNLIDKGVKDRLSVNGEILRMQNDLRKRQVTLKRNIEDMGVKLSKRPGGEQEQHLRDSISTILTSGKSMASNILDTPQSSPPSSVMTKSFNGSFDRQATASTASSSKLPRTRRTSNLGASTPIARPSRASDISRAVTSPLPRGESSAGRYKGKREERPFREFKEPNNKPKWNAGGIATIKAEKRDFLPLSATVPSPYRRTEPTPRKYTPSRSSTRQQRYSSSVREEVEEEERSPTPAVPSLSPATLKAVGASSLSAAKRKLMLPRAASAMDYRSLSVGANLTLAKTAVNATSSSSFASFSHCHTAQEEQQRQQQQQHREVVGSGTSLSRLSSRRISNAAASSLSKSHASPRMLRQVGGGGEDRVDAASSPSFSSLGAPIHGGGGGGKRGVASPSSSSPATTSQHHPNRASTSTKTPTRSISSSGVAGHKDNATATTSRATSLGLSSVAAAGKASTVQTPRLSLAPKTSATASFRTATRMDASTPLSRVGRRSSVGGVLGGASLHLSTPSSPSAAAAAEVTVAGSAGSGMAAVSGAAAPTTRWMASSTLAVGLASQQQRGKQKGLMWSRGNGGGGLDGGVGAGVGIADDRERRRLDGGAGRRAVSAMGLYRAAGGGAD